MLKGYTVPRTPTGKSSLNPPPPWHDSGDVAGVELSALAPVRNGAGVRMGLSYTVTDLQLLGDLTHGHSVECAAPIHSITGVAS